MDEIFDIKEIRLREKQVRCSHPSLKCHLCGLHIDEIRHRQNLKIQELEEKIAKYEEILTSHNISFFLKEIDRESGIIKESTTIVKIKDDSNTGTDTLQEMGLLYDY